MFGKGDNRKAKGAILVDGKLVAETHQCVHCGKHFTVQPGSGKMRGFCLKCMGPTCGAKECDICRPYEKQIEEIEKLIYK